MLGLQTFRTGIWNELYFFCQHLLFEAAPQAQLEIHSAKIASAIPADTIVCQQLQVDAGEDNR